MINEPEGTDDRHALPAATIKYYSEAIEKYLAWRELWKEEGRFEDDDQEALWKGADHAAAFMIRHAFGGTVPGVMATIKARTDNEA